MNIYNFQAPQPDSNSEASKLYIFDATTISLFQEVLRTSGKNPSGKRKGGIKVHTLIRSDQDVPL